MSLPLARLALLATLASSYLTTQASATALTTAISANERLCFYADVDKAGEKIGVTYCYFQCCLRLAKLFSIFSFTLPCNPEAHLISILKWKTRMRRCFSMDLVSVKETTFWRQIPSANMHSASRMICQHWRKNWWTLTLWLRANQGGSHQRKQGRSRITRQR